MTEPKVLDRRHRKSRAALQGALLTLIATKPYETVTIDDVTAEADVARATFYAHYKDKPALLLEAATALLAELTELLGVQAVMSGAAYRDQAVTTIFEHAAAHRHLYLLLIDGRGGAAARELVFATFEAAAETAFVGMSAQAGREPRIPLTLAAIAYAGAQLRTVERWLGDDPHQLPDDVVTAFLLSQVGGLEWMLGFEPGETELVPQHA